MQRDLDQLNAAFELIAIYNVQDLINKTTQAE